MFFRVLVEARERSGLDKVGPKKDTLFCLGASKKI